MTDFGQRWVEERSRSRLLLVTALPQTIGESGTPMICGARCQSSGRTETACHCVNVSCDSQNTGNIDST